MTAHEVQHPCFVELWAHSKSESPVFAGLTYDRPAIMRWIQQHRRDPTTAQKLKAHHLSPNLSLRTVIQSWIDSNR